jgi:hypothetical protein
MADNQPEKVSKDELIGFHKGSLNTLIAERNELLKMVNITEQLIQAHIKELESLGIKLATSKPEAESTK